MPPKIYPRPCTRSPSRRHVPQSRRVPEDEVRVGSLRGEGEVVVALAVLLGALAGGAAGLRGAVAGAEAGLPGLAAEVAELVAAAAAFLC